MLRLPWGEGTLQKLKRELLAEIAVVNFNGNSAAADFLLGRKWFSIPSLIVCKKKKKQQFVIASQTVTLDIIFIAPITGQSGSVD